ncbi:MAG TPA: cytochrome b N-terminal domain-containing protein [Anaerolineae bacterium]|nr:cytochrome b N-terminal domain-containing protein [Anaerolineae bacterium]
MKIEPFHTLNEMRKEHGLVRTIGIKIDESVTRFTAGLGINDIRGVLRGDPPPRPNPRVKPHTEGAWFHVWPSFYHVEVTKVFPTFRLGLISTALFLIEFITGLFLMLFYTPSPTAAYNDMLRILSNVPLGMLVRDIHRLAAEGMVLAVALHMWRTFLTGSYKKPRQFTYFTGVLLLFFTLLLSFTGYLLPWDQLSLWAVTIGASMADATPPPAVGEAVGLLLRGGLDLGADGLLRFYLLHVFALPSALILFLFVHYYKVVRHGHSLPPGMDAPGEDTARKVSPDKRVPFLPDIATSEMLWFGLISVVLVVGSAFFYDAPLENQADPLNTPLHTVAPWYFLWIQGMLKLGDKSFWGVIVPGGLLLLHMLLPYYDYNPSRRARDRRFAWAVSFFSVGVIVFLSFMGSSAYLVGGAPETEVGFQFMRPERLGAEDIRRIPFDKMLPGTYDTAALPEELASNSPELHQRLEILQHLIVRYQNPNLPPEKQLTNGHAVVEIEDWAKDTEEQPVLRKITLTLMWDNMSRDAQGNPQPFVKTIFAHRDSIYSIEE